MPYAQDITSYEIERQVFEAALVHDQPLIYELPSAKEAVTFRARAYLFRRMASKNGDKRFNLFRLIIDEKEKNRIRFERATATGTLMTASGVIIPLIKPEAPVPQFKELSVKEALQTFNGLEAEDEN